VGEGGEDGAGGAAAADAALFCLLLALRVSQLLLVAYKLS
jgi:hypothetical protein